MANGSDSGDRKATFARNLVALNSQFAAWVAEQSSGAPKELWTDGVEDYLKYAKQLLADFKDVLEGGSKPEAAPAPAAGGFGFGFGSSTGAAAPAPAGGSAKPPLAPGGLFGAGAGSGSQGAAAPASIFGPLPTTGGAFTLGTSGGGGFGGSTPGSAANSAGGSLFNVPSTGTLGSSFGTAATGAEDDDGDEEAEQPAEPSVQLEAEGTEMLAKQRVKLMSMTPEKKWKDKGQGTLTLRRATGEDAAGKKPYFVFTTDSGRVLINAPLVAGMKPMSNAKAPASVIMFLISSVDGKEERAMHMFRCESPDAAKQLMQTITEHT
ncbi:1 domain containing expressed [Chlorella sorokiniana]|uniref:1 domain containing expressed n=1 Tax=Chlorella sorokiniana TaxID=3076 RepID=A0A2P6U1I5_CHLSO|nr:1 domain containing expressed [Chlorella sorokiniana]|eukprot:PRW60168.1 1 domain containing expressed [Chlorella sorokiniana]